MNSNCFHENIEATTRTVAYLCTNHSNDSMKNHFPSENLLELITYEFNKVFHCCQAFRRYSHFLEMNLIEMQLQMNYWWIHFSLPFAFIFKIWKRGGNSPLFFLMVISPSSITRWNVTHSTFKFLWIFFTYLPFINYFQKLKKSSALPYHHCAYFFSLSWMGSARIMDFKFFRRISFSTLFSWT